MTANPFDRWPELDALLARALDTPPPDRPAFLDTVCGDDADLRNELERLLASEAEAGSFLERRADWFAVSPAPDPGSKLGEEADPLPVGSRVGPYELMERIGTGGMGVVYKARDTRLDRPVALKFLRPWFVADRDAKARFLREARTASALDHPAVCTIHDIGETDDGQVYIGMTYYAGETLAERLKRGWLPVGEALGIARAVGSALERAHEAGIVHRDLKPGNVMLTDHGEVKLLDFGIAKLEGQDFTKTGTRLGTVSYMSPEQAAGDSVDRQTDVWALGAVLYEMVTGRRAFRGDNDQATIHAILNETPEPVTRLRPDATIPLETVIGKALAKSKSDRYQGMPAFLADLSAVAHGDRPAPAPSSRFAASLRPIIGFAGLVLVLAILGTWALTRGRIRGGTSVPVAGGASATTIAVLPFDIVGSELADWREGLVRLLSIELDGAGGLHTIDERTILARWDAAQAGETVIDRPASLRIAEQTGARLALLGSAIAIGSQARLVADVYDVPTRTRIDQLQVEGHPDSMLALVDRLSVEVMGAILRTGEAELPPLNLASITTTSVPALKAYLEGEVHFRGAEFEAAIEAYERAVAADSTFALAHFHLASAWAWHMNIQNTNARRHRAAALRHMDRLPAREAAIVRGRYATGEQRAAAVTMLEAAVSSYPDDAEAWLLLADAHIHTGALTGPEQADPAFERAAELEPAFAAYQPHSVELAFNHLADSSLAAKRLEQYASVAPGSRYLAAGRLAFSLTFGDPASRAEALAALDTVDLGMLPAASYNLNHPQMWETRERVLRAMRDRGGPTPAWVTTAADFLAAESLWKRGMLNTALVHLADPSVSTVTRVCLPAVARGWGVPVPLDVLEAALALPITDPGGPLHFRLACQGYIAADLGRWPDHAATAAAAEESARAAWEAGETDSAVRLEAAVAEIRAYGLWRHGDPSRALALFEDARSTAWYLGDWPIFVHRKANWYPNVWPGFLLLETGRADEALGWFRRPWYNPLARFREAQVHEALGNMAAAREAYAAFTDAWAKADPELQHWVEEARHSLARLAVEGT